jgi:hypothetical protein
MDPSPASAVSHIFHLHASQRLAYFKARNYAANNWMVFLLCTNDMRAGNL